MTYLSQHVSVDSRSPMERLRRAQLHKIADLLGIKYSPGAPKTAMIKLLEANDVDVTKPIGDLQWQLVHPSPQAIQGATLMGEPPPPPMLVPISPIHASERNNVNAQAVLSTRVSEKAQERQKDKKEVFNDSRIAAMERDYERVKLENEHLRAVLEKRLKHLESVPLEQPSPSANDRKAPNVSARREYWALYRKAKERGLPVKRSMTKADLEEMLETR